MDVSIFEKAQTQLQGIYDEMSALSKKKPDDAVNKFKLKFINQVLIETNKILKDDYVPFPDFDHFEADDLPTNSDIVVILSQYLNCLEKLRADNIVNDYGTWYWMINGIMSEIRTAAPKKIHN